MFVRPNKARTSMRFSKLRPFRNVREFQVPRLQILAPGFDSRSGLQFQILSLLHDATYCGDRAQ